MLFDRVYDPIAEKYPNYPAHLIEPSEWVKFDKQTWLYTDSTPEYLKNRRARDILITWNIYDEAVSRAKELRKIPHKIAKE